LLRSRLGLGDLLKRVGFGAETVRFEKSVRFITLDFCWAVYESFIVIPTGDQP
jgi:hypothetical protein